MTKPKSGLDAATLQAGQRVSRKTTGELGMVIEADGEVKVKWDRGGTSYFRRNKSADVRLVETKR